MFDSSLGEIVSLVQGVVRFGTGVRDLDRSDGIAHGASYTIIVRLWPFL